MANSGAVDWCCNPRQIIPATVAVLLVLLQGGISQQSFARSSPVDNCLHNTSGLPLYHQTCSLYHSPGICSKHLGNFSITGSTSDHANKDRTLRSLLDPVKRILTRFSAFPNSPSGFQQFRSIVSYLALLRGVSIPSTMYPEIWAVFQNESTPCYQSIERVFCHQYFPFCQEVAMQKVKLELCKESCESSLTYCSGILKMVNKLKARSFFRIPTCDLLPQRQAGAIKPCFNAELTSDSKKAPSDQIKGECMRHDNATYYTGNVNRTVSGLDCQQWHLSCPHAHAFTGSHFKETRRAGNRCRNPGGLSSGPWCFTTSPTVRWEYCAVCKETDVQESNNSSVVAAPVPTHSTPTPTATDRIAMTSHARGIAATPALSMTFSTSAASTPKLASPLVSFTATSAILTTSASSEGPVTTQPPPTTKYPPYIRPWVDRVCPVYNGSVQDNPMCLDFLGNNRIRSFSARIENKQRSLNLFYDVMMPVLRSFVKRGGNLDISSVIQQYIGRNVPNVTEEFSKLTMPTLQSFDRCSEIGLEYSCYYFNPWCRISETPINFEANPILLCRDACKSAQNVCSAELKFLRTFNRIKARHPDMLKLNSYYVELPNCTALPQKAPGYHQTCFMPGFFIAKQLNSRRTETCYDEQGLMYRGNISITQKGQPCLDWSELNLADWHSATNEDLNYLKNSSNHCRNPQNMGTRPWCLHRNASGEISWDYCNVTHCPVNGGFGEWSSYSNCSKLCGLGQKTRTRVCNNPAPMFGGLDCTGVRVEKSECLLKSCPVDGGYSDWVDVPLCNTTCGSMVGIQERYRTCTNPSPRYGGRNCTRFGPGREFFPCYSEYCDPPSSLEADTKRIHQDGASGTIYFLAGSMCFVLAIIILIAIVILRKNHMVCWSKKRSEDSDDDSIEAYGEVVLTPDNIAAIIRETTPTNDGNQQIKHKPRTGIISLQNEAEEKSPMASNLEHRMERLTSL